MVPPFQSPYELEDIPLEIKFASNGVCSELTLEDAINKRQRILVCDDRGTGKTILSHHISQKSLHTDMPIVFIDCLHSPKSYRQLR